MQTARTVGPTVASTLDSTVGATVGSTVGSTMGSTVGAANGDRLKGIIAVLLSCVMSGFASVYSQGMLQKSGFTPGCRRCDMALCGQGVSNGPGHRRGAEAHRGAH